MKLNDDDISEKKKPKIPDTHNDFITYKGFSKTINNKINNNNLPKQNYLFFVQPYAKRALRVPKTGRGIQFRDSR
jgi:hypothetical protein